MDTRLDRRPPTQAPEPGGLRKAILLVEKRAKEQIWDCRMCGQWMREFLHRAVEDGAADAAWILAGVYVPRSARAACYLRDMVPGIDVPDDVVRRLEGVPKEAQEAEGIRLTVEVCEELRETPGVAGIHLMSIKGDQAILQVIEELGLTPGAALEHGRAVAGAGARKGRRGRRSLRTTCEFAPGTAVS